jgi:phosphoribosylaminoimidazole-succinocarboxamide synthase
MGTDPRLLRDQCEHTLARTDFAGIGRREEGKVRDSYIRETERTIVVSDRVSCFDVVVGTLPFKGQVLNQLAAFWFERSTGIAPNHLLSVPDPSVSIVRELAPMQVEFVMRGYLTGSSPTSIWTAYDGGAREYCGHALPDGMKAHEPLPEPLLTPTTKAPKGEHDELTSREEIIAGGTLSEEVYDKTAKLANALFADGQAWAASRGLILVDTKYEIALQPDGSLVVVDEIHTPDSSRYWYRDRYERALSEGRAPEALDKEYVRRWLGDQGYKGNGPPPELPIDVRCEASRRYIEAFEQITGRDFEPDTQEPNARIARNLGIAS